MPSKLAADTFPIQFIALADDTGHIDSQWLAGLPRAEGDPAPLSSTLAARRADFATCRDLALQLGGGQAILFIRNGLKLPEYWRQRLTGSMETPDRLPRLPCGNYADMINPLAGLAAFATPEEADRWLWLCAEHTATPVRNFPVDCLYLPPEAASLDQDTPALLVDSLFVHDQDRALSAGSNQQPDVMAALGTVRLRLQLLAEQTSPSSLPAAIGLDGRPVTLHISHNWGGGVARWIEDIVRADQETHHLVLSSSGDPDGTTHGQTIRLYAAGPGQARVREWPLTPPIADTTASDARYRQLLDKIVQRFAIGRIIVSSLIGHSLDALRMGLPTAHVLHDFYPAWPLLDHDPLTWIKDNGHVDLDCALAEHGHRMLFSHRCGQHWRTLTSVWLDAIDKGNVRLMAPTGEVVKRWQALCGESLPEVAVIPHGFSEWSGKPSQVTGRGLPDGRLHLVVVGRLSPGKGLELLEHSLAKLQPLARITLLGCGRHGMRFFGIPGIDILLDYRRNELPAVLNGLAPQAGLFLSTVGETWNYVLSELRSLGIPPIATRLGSFIERIEPGHNGWLFDPKPDALVNCIARLHAEPGQLNAAAQLQPTDPDMPAVMDRYSSIVPVSPSGLPALGLASPGQADSGHGSWQLADLRAQISSLNCRQQELTAELERRTAWAQRYERLSEKRTRWARSLENEIQQERIVVQTRLDLLETERQQTELALIDTRERLDVSQDHLAQTREHLQSTQQELQSTQQELHRSGKELERTQEELRLIFASRSWRWTRPLRFVNRVVEHGRQRRAWNPLRWPRLARRLIHSLRFHGLRGTLHLTQGTAPEATAPSTLPRVEPPLEQHRHEGVVIPAAQRPLASIVIPVYNKLAYTVACLDSLAAHAGAMSFEVIVVDDCSNDNTADFLARCDGIEVICNTENSGFIASCNAGAGRANGRFLVFLNNDTTVTEGWLEALMATFEDFPDAGIVGARLAYPNGRLQEAGGIIFSDASGWNYGRNEDPVLPQYNFAAEADYVSGACLAISRELFEELGGFDSHYAPAYYEDTDLCFRVRQHGRKVYCQPACTIIHHEGVSSGTDESSGIKRYQAVNRDKFRERWRSELAEQPLHRIDSNRPDPVRRARFHRACGQVLLIDATTPMPDHDSGSVRFTAMMELMVEQGWLVTFCPQNLKWEGHYSSSLQQKGIEVLTTPAVSSLEPWLKTYGQDLDLVLVSRHYVLKPILELLRRTCPRARIIFDTVDLHFLREQRQAALNGSAAMAAAAQRTRTSELGLMRACDITLVVSPIEQKLLTDLLPETDIRVLSNIHTIHGVQQVWAGRRDLIFIGGFQHPPNIDAAEWLIDEIFPRIRRELPDVKLHLIGSRMPDKLREKASAGVIVHGFVEDLTPYLKGCRLSLAPLRYGAGVKGKVNQAMAWGLPVVATTCAAEGMFLQHGEDVLMADNGETFAAEVARAYQDEQLWSKLSQGGLANVDRYFSRTAAARVIQTLLSQSAPLRNHSVD